MHRFPRLIAPLLALTLLVGCGGSDDEAPKASRTVNFNIADAGFEPKQLSFPVGTTVEFVFQNQTPEDHEVVFGDEATQREHEDQMKRQPDMPMHKSKTFTEVHAGATERFTFTFDKAGTTFIACHNQPEPEHWASGEQTTVTVT